jgi:4-hydroxy-tetrahydrodipicolinate reductase
MGSEVCRAVAADPALQLVAAVDPFHAGESLADTAGLTGSDVVIAAEADAFVAAGVQVAIDFTHAEAAHTNMLWCAGHGIHAVVGTTGFTASQIDQYRAAFTSSNCLIAPNFAIGAVLMMRFAEMAAPFFETAEIIEFHHDKKIDAPSGTATATAQRMAERMMQANRKLADDPTQKEVYPGARGGLGPADIRVHAVRMRGMVAHQEVILGTTGQTLVIRHDTTDRTSFMPGVVLAAKRIAEVPGLVFGLDPYLDL